MTTQIDQAIAAAKEAGSKTPAPIVAQQAAVPAAYIAPGKPRSFADAAADSSMSVDNYLKVDEYGLHVDGDKATFETIDVTIDLSEVQWPVAVRYMAAGRANYDKSYDGIRNSRGKPWGEVLNHAMTMDPLCRGQYSMADVPMTLDQDLVLKDKSVLKAGTRLGYSTSITGYKSFLNWFKSMDQQFQGNLNNEVSIRVGFSVKKKNGNEWGELTWNSIQ